MSGPVNDKRYFIETNTWNEVEIDGRVPSARDRHSMVYFPAKVRVPCTVWVLLDVSRVLLQEGSNHPGKLVVFGGHCEESEYCNDLYEFSTCITQQ